MRINLVNNQRVQSFKGTVTLRTFNNYLCTTEDIRTTKENDLKIIEAARKACPKESWARIILNMEDTNTLNDVFEKAIGKKLSGTNLPKSISRFGDSVLFMDCFPKSDNGAVIDFTPSNLKLKKHKPIQFQSYFPGFE